METKTPTPANLDVAAADAPTVQITPSGREALKIFEKEIATYLRELPALLAQGQAGRHALVKGDAILGIWDAQADALEAGRERFGLEPIFVKAIDARDTERFALLKRHLGDACPY